MLTADKAELQAGGYHSSTNTEERSATARPRGVSDSASDLDLAAYGGAPQALPGDVHQREWGRGGMLSERNKAWAR